MKCVDCPLCHIDYWEYDCCWECTWDEHSLGGFGLSYINDPKSIYYKRPDNQEKLKIVEETKEQECSLSVEELEKLIEFFSNILKEKQGVAQFG